MRDVTAFGIAPPATHQRMRAFRRQDLRKAGVGFFDAGGEATFSRAFFFRRAGVFEPVFVNHGDVGVELLQDASELWVVGGVVIFGLVKGGEVRVVGWDVFEFFGEVCEGFLTDAFGDFKDEIVDNVMRGEGGAALFVRWRRREFGVYLIVSPA